LDNDTFLKQLGCWKQDRESSKQGYTAAALLMFGEGHAIEDAFPNYMLDYQEHAENSESVRWIDRIVPDGTWSGNIFDFYRRVIVKLEQDVKTPFSLQNNMRIDDTLLHQSLREALINCLVHADYSGKASIKVVQSPQSFYFRNPGVMRISVDTALMGGESDCRNRTLHKLFLLLGLGERAGSGLPKISQGWATVGEVLLSDSHEPYSQTVMQLIWNTPNLTTQETTQETAQETTQETTQETSQEIDYKLSKKQKDIIDFLQLNPSASRKDIAVNVDNITEDGVKYNLKRLQELGLIKRAGATKSGIWKIV
jgi:predicted HTH transcriptional regulator